MPLVKTIAARLPLRWQLDLKRRLYARQIRRGTFATDEPEYERLPDLLQPGDWVLDIGANVGHYTKRFSELVGPGGRVIAVEPTPATFSLLAANALLFAHPNVTLLNVAGSDHPDVVGLSIPKFDSGLDNFYEAQLAPGGANAEQFGLQAAMGVAIAVPVLSLACQVALKRLAPHRVPAMVSTTEEA